MNGWFFAHEKQQGLFVPWLSINLSARHVFALDVNQVEFSCALAHRDPAWFNETWLSRIKEESGDNWRLKVMVDLQGCDSNALFVICITAS